MELNFDKEMDALLRQAARQETPAQAAKAGEAHLDVDELAAFSANALPVKARARAMEHLVDCGNCRTILSNLVFFEHQEEEKPAAFAALAPVVKEASLLERILGVFKFPTLAYGMAGLVLVFTAAIGFVVLFGNPGAELAQLTPQMNKPAAADAAPSQYPATLNEAPMPMNSNAAANSPGIASAANSAAVGGVFTMPSSTASGTTPGYAANSSSTVAPGEGPKDVGGRLDDSETKSETKIQTGKEIDKLNASPPPAPVVKSDLRQEETQPQLAKPQQTTNTDQVTRGQDNYRSNNNIMTPDGSDKDRKRAVSGEAGANMTREGLRDEKEKQAQTEATAPENKNEPAKKAAGKKPKKKTAAADAAAQPSPSPSPAKTPEKKPEDPPCR